MKVDANQQSHPGNNTVAGLSFYDLYLYMNEINATNKNIKMS